MSVRRLLPIAIAVFVLSALAWVFVIPRFRPHVFHGVVMQSATPAPALGLEATTGGTLDLDSLEGKVIVMYFGYTHCPDVCPVTLAALNDALESLGNGAEDVQVMMVTVDPERDTLPLLHEYLGFFNDSFIGLTGSLDDISRVATAYGVFFAPNEGDATTGYTVAHNASLMVIDKDGHLRLILPPEVTAEEIAADLDYLL